MTYMMIMFESNETYRKCEEATWDKELKITKPRESVLIIY